MTSGPQPIRTVTLGLEGRAASTRHRAKTRFVGCEPTEFYIMSCAVVRYPAITSALAKSQHKRRAQSARLQPFTPSWVVYYLCNLIGPQGDPKNTVLERRTDCYYRDRRYATGHYSVVRSPLYLRKGLSTVPRLRKCLQAWVQDVSLSWLFM